MGKETGNFVVSLSEKKKKKKCLKAVLFIYFCLFAFSRATPSAYGCSQARGPIGAVAAGLPQSHRNVGSEPRLQPTPQLMAMPDR